jgi:predicted RNase H-like HicB family nuclease
MSDYEITIFYSAEDGGYIAEIPQLAHCSAFGNTPAQALAQVEIARDAWLAAARDEGRPIPRPEARAVGRT